MIVQYPKYLYHFSHAPRVVDTHEEREALGDAWVESPAFVVAPAEDVTEDALELAVEKPKRKRK